MAQTTNAPNQERFLIDRLPQQETAKMSHLLINLTAEIIILVCRNHCEVQPLGDLREWLCR
jgi:hypothetical protein